MAKLPAGTLSKVPEVTLGFWAIKVLATTLGETGGDAAGTLGIEAKCRATSGGPRSHARNEQQFGEVDRCPIRCCSQIGVKARRQHVAWADIVMSRHDQMRQRELHRSGMRVVRFSPTCQGRQFARDPVWTQGLQNAKLTAARCFSTLIGEIDDLTLPDSIDGGVGLLDKTFQAFRKPVIPASLLAVAIHPLLDDNPLAIIGHDESMQIEIKAILNGGAVHLGDEPARICERRPVKANPLPD